MRRAVTLYEFMPYGAPELLESRRRHMSRALVLTSAAALGLYALTRGVASLIPVPTAAPTHRVFEPEPFVIPQERVEVMPPARRMPPARVTHPAAPPEPVRDDIARPSELIDPAPGQVKESETGVIPGTIERGTVVGPAPEVLPELGQWVYVEQEPAAIKEVKPDYPSIAREAGVEGRVTVHVLISKEGRVLDAVLARNVQVPMLNESALTAARQWVFTPGYANGHPVACWTAIPFHFRLH